MMPRICAVLPCSAALARPIHHPDTRRVISWGLGNTAATRGTSMKGRRHTEASSPPHDRTDTHTHANASCKSCALVCTRLFDSWTQPPMPNSPVKSTIKTCCTSDHSTPVPFTTTATLACKQYLCSRKLSHAAHSETSLLPRQLPICSTTTRNSKLVQAN